MRRSKIQSSKFKIQNQVLLPLTFFLGNFAFLIAPLPSTPHPSPPLLAQTLEDRKADADRLFEQGTQQLGKDQYLEALGSFEQALIIYRKLEERLKEGHTLRSMGNVYLTQKDYPNAVVYYQQALEVARSIKDTDLESRALNNLGLAYRDSGKLVQGMEYLEQALAIAEQHQNPFMELVALQNLAVTYRSLKQPEQSIKTAQRLLTRAQELNETSFQLEALLAIINTYNTLKNYPKALEGAQQLLELAEKAENHRMIAIALSSVGDFNRALGQYKAAVPYYQRGIEVSRKASEPTWETQNLEGLARAYLGLKEFPKAIAAAEQSSAVYQKLDSKPGQLSALDVMLAIYQAIALDAHHRGDRVQLNQSAGRVIQLGQQKLELAKAWNQPGEEANTLLRLGDIHKLISDEDQRLDNLTKSLKFFDQARTLYKTLDAPAGQVNALLGAMRVHTLIASFARDQKNHPERLQQANRVLTLATEALQIARGLEDRDLEKQILGLKSDAYTTIAAVYKELRDFGKAEASAQTAVDIAHKSENWRAQNGALGILQSIYGQQGEYRKQIEVEQQTLEIARRQVDPVGEVFALAGIGSSYGLFGNLSQAIIYRQQALAKAESIDLATLPFNVRPHLRIAQMRALSGLSLDHRLMGDYNRALEFSQQHLALARRMAEPGEEVMALMDLGQTYASRQELPQAIASTQQALAIAQSKPSSNIPNQPKLEVDALAQLSQLYAAQEHYPKAIELGQQALQIAQKSGELELQTKALKALTKIYGAQGKTPQALEFLQQSTELSRKLPSALTRSLALITLGYTYVTLGDYQTSRTLYTEALSEAQKVGFVPVEALAWLQLAHVAWAQGEAQKAVELAEKGVAVAQDKTPPLALNSHFILSLSYGEMGNEQQAVAAANTALAISRQLQDTNNEKGTLTLLGNLHRRFGRFEEAIATYQAALSISKNLENSRAAIANTGIYAGLARTYADRNQPEVAIVFYKQAINGIEDRRSQIKELSTDLQQSFLQATFDFDQVKTADIYRQLADLLISQGRIGEGQQVLELLKVQELNDFTGGTRSSTRLAELALSETEQQIQQKYQSLVAFGQRVKQCQPAECTPLREQLRQLQTQFDQYIQTVQTQIKDGTIVRIDQRSRDFIASASKIVDAQPGTVMIYPLVMGDRIHLLWASAGGVLSSATCPMGEIQLNQTIAEFRTALRIPGNPTRVQTLGKELYDCLIKPIETKGNWQANQVRNLVIAPDHAINYIPLAALFDGKQYLIQKYAVSNVLNAGLTDVSDRLPSNPKILGLGISEAIEGFSPLPHVEKEIQAIVKAEGNAQGIYPGTVFMNEAFTETSLESNLRGRNIVHIATHGQFDSTNPNDSFLLLSSGKTGEGERYAISRIKFLEDLRGVHLVILSACETGLGELAANGLEIQGISSYFVQDRAKAVIASLWMVDDASTSYLMQQLYKNLAHGTPENPITKAEALRQAQLSLLQAKKVSPEISRGLGVVADSASDSKGQPESAGDFSHPYYWAPFILIGNGL